jgi:hypothetical protein
MPDPATPNTPATPDSSANPDTPAAPPETPDSPSSINQTYAAAITRAEEIARVALKGAYASFLAQHQMPASFAAGIVNRAAAARELQTRALAADVTQSGDTDSIETLRQRLTSAMQQMQSWARAVHFFSNPARLTLYHVGEDLDANLPSLQQYSLDVRKAALDDQLAGVTPAFLQSYDATRRALFGPETIPQPEPSASASADPEPDDAAVDLRDVLARRVRDLTHDSMRILFLADGIWPHGQPGSAGPRHAFGLPADRPYAPAAPDAPVPGANPSMG